MTELDIQAQKDYAVKEALAKGEAKGKAEGLAEGEAQKSLEIAKNMLTEGLSVDCICRVTGLTKEAVSALR
jgi:predicted transposase/invertase (TIGR01784 family)